MKKKDRKFIEDHIDIDRILAYQEQRKRLPELRLTDFLLKQMPHNDSYAEQNKR